MVVAQQSSFYLETWQASQGAQPAVSLDRVLSTPNRFGGAFTAGSVYNESAGYYDLLVTQYHGSGTVMYQDTFNLPVPGNIIVGAITTNSNKTELFVTGTVYNGSANSYDVLTMKYGVTGQVDWYSTYNGIGNGYDGGSSLLVDSDTIYVGGAITDTTGLFGALCIKYLDGGTEVWDHVTTVNNRDLVIGTLSKSNPGELTIGVGLEFNNGTHRVGSAVLATSDGSTLSGFSENSQVDLDEIIGFAADTEQNLYVTGYSNAAGNGDDIVTVMLDDTLGLVWESVYNGAANSDDRPSSLDIDSLGNVYVGGYATTSNDRDFAVIKYNNSGTQLWAALYDGPSHGDDEAKAVVAGKDGLVYATGSTDTLGQKDYHTRILKASDGTTEWSSSFNGLHSKDDEATSIALDGEGGLSVLGKNGLSNGKTEYMLVRYAKKELVIPPGDGGASPAIAFTEQRGQLTDTSGTSVDDIRFYSLGTNPSIFVRKDTLSLVGSRIDSSASTTDTLHRVDISFKDSKSSLMSVAGLEKQPYYENYYLDHIQEGRAKVGQYGRVVISDLYDNINLQLFASPSGVKYYFVVEPGGDPSDIELELNGQDALAIDSKGRLGIQTSLHDFLLASPSSFQLDTANQKTSTSWQPEFSISGSNVTFDSIGVFDTTKVLVIVLEEPISKEEDGSGNVEWCTYFGGTNYEEIFESDATEGNEYAITGLTFSPDFPNENGVFNYLAQSDAFVSTFDSELNLSWSSYIGGNFDDRGNDVVFSGASGFNLILVGSTAGSGTGTNSAGFPILDNGFSFIDDSNSCATENSTCRNAFITLFTADGQINHSTFFGVDQSATITGGTAQAFALHESPSKNIYIGGLGVVPTNTITGGDFTDYEGTGFIAKFGNNLSSIEWSTGFMDNVSSINSDGFGNIFVLGRYVDNTGDTYGAPIQENSNSDVYSFNGGSSDIGISKINEANNDLVWFSYFGGDGGDNESAMDVDNQGNVVFTGETSSTDFQVQSSGVTGSLFQNTIDGSSDGFVAKYSNTGQLLASSYYNSGNFLNFTSVKGDANGNIIVGGLAQGGISTINYQSFYSQAATGTTNIDGFLLGLDGDFTPYWTTYFGADGVDAIYTLDVTSDHLFLGGVVTQTPSSPTDTDFPLMMYSNKPESYFVDFINEPSNQASLFLARLSYDALTSTKDLKLSKDSELVVYPNPALETLEVKVSKGEIFSFVVYNALGQVVEIKENVGNSFYVLDIHAYPSGTYFITVRSSYGNSSTQFTKVGE